MEEAKDTDAKMIAFAIAFCTGIAFIMLVLSPVFPMLYNTSDQVRQQATYILMAQAIFMPQAAFLNASYFTLRAGGKTGITFLFDCVFIWLVSIPVVFVLSRYTDLPAHYVYAFGQIADGGKCILGFVLVKKGVWINNLVKEK